MMIKENEIRPNKIFKKYLKLSEKDAEIHFLKAKRSKINCIACNSNNSSKQFVKNTFDFYLCKNCKTLYQSPRPNPTAFKNFYTNSVSSSYWAEVFFPTVEQVRLKKIIKPRARKLSKILKNLSFKPELVIDVGAGHGSFLNELVSCFKGTKGIAIEPSKAMADSCREKNFVVYEKLLEDIDESKLNACLTCSLEVFEHVHNPLSFLKKKVSITKKGGWVFFTTLGVDGFDIQLLWENSNSIYPPHHLNFLSVKGFKILCERAGLTNVKIITPGVLDTDIVKNRTKEMPNFLDNNRFIKHILNDLDKTKKFQKFLSTNLMSSHTWVLAQKV